MKHSLKQTCSKLAVRAFPHKAAGLLEGSVVPQTKLDRLILNKLIAEAAESEDLDLLRKQFTGYWRGAQGDDFYESYRDRFEEWFKQDHYPVVKALKKQVDETPGTFSQLCEIGCGDGQVLNHLASVFPDMERLTGIDINENIIVRNREAYCRNDDRLEFVAGDAFDWLKENIKPGTVVMTYGGVFEYFLQNELEELFGLLQANSPVLVALVEPLYNEFDLETEFESRSSGQEHSFTHNYPKLLQESGFELIYQSEPKMEFRWIMIVAKG